MAADVVDLRELDRDQVELAGGKGALLGELTRIPGVVVPPGFCVTTAAFARVRARDAATLPDDLVAAITAALERVGPATPCAVRSSATGEDQPTASFAGQHDTFLNVVGAPAVLDAIGRCWASLSSDRAVAYRARSGIDPDGARMAVVVQALVEPDASGVLFTADPVSGHRRIAVVEGVPGLGEALVSGTVEPDVLRVRHGVVVEAAIATKASARRASPGGGTEDVAVPTDERRTPVLSDEQALALVALGRRIEAHLGAPQDIEWCRVGDDLVVVQSRPITTLFPVPDLGDAAPRVFLSVGHQQMMTDPIRPLGISIWQMTAKRPMYEAGARLFVDATAEVTSPVTRPVLMGLIGRSDPLVRDALETILERGDLLPSAPAPDPTDAPAGPPGGPADPPEPLPTDVALVVERMARMDASVAAAAQRLATVSGPAVFAAIRADLVELQGELFDPRSHQMTMAGMEAAWWLDDHLEAWLGEQAGSGVLSESVDHNPTSAMGLALLDVADVIRPHPEVVAYLGGVGEDDDVLEGLTTVPGGDAVRAALGAWLDRYGARCVGEIDLTRPRWCERPGALVPVLLGNVRHFEPGESRRRFEAGRQEAARAADAVLARLRALPDGEAKAAEAAEMIERMRTFLGYREFPKFAMVRRYLAYKRALLAEADRLVAAGVLGAREDAFLLSFDELEAAAHEGRVADGLVERRRRAFRAAEALHPPRVLTSEGEALTGSFRRDGLPDGALVGLAVSPGTVEGRARVLARMADADLEAGDILVTTHTDPSWSPLFVAVAGLVTEVGGRMTHGAVIAREYGLPAVVSVAGATTRIRDGQRIRVHGSDGYVELLG